MDNCETCIGVRTKNYGGMTCLICRQSFCTHHIHGHKCIALKIFEMNSCPEWVMANDVEEAVKIYLEHTDDHDPEYYEDAAEISQKQYDTLIYYDDVYDMENSDKRSFREEMIRRVQAGIGPEYFATSEW